MLKINGSAGSFTAAVSFSHALWFEKSVRIKSAFSDFGMFIGLRCVNYATFDEYWPVYLEGSLLFHRNLDSEFYNSTKMSATVRLPCDSRNKMVSATAGFDYSSTVSDAIHVD